MLNKVKWLATIILIVGTAVNGLGFYPAGPLILVLGGVIWLGVAIKLQDWPLITTNLVMSFVGLAAVAWSLYANPPIQYDAPLEGSAKADSYYDNQCSKD